MSSQLRPTTRQQLHEKPRDVLDHATSEIASGSKLGFDATKKIPGEGFKRPWPPLIKMDAAVKAKVEKLFSP
jgi:4-hydroxy-3-polyprenylbenzoate decarboxylase